MTAGNPRGAQGATPATPGRVLIIKPSSLGDVVSALPVLGGLRRSFPDAHIAWLVTPGCAGILQGQPDLNEIIPFDRKHYGRIGRSWRVTADFVRFCQELRGRRFDWVIDLQGLFRSGFLCAVSGAKVRAGFASARELAPLFYTYRVACTAAHTIDRNIELVKSLGVDARPEDLRLTLTSEAQQFASELLRQHGLARRQFVVLAPGTRWANKVYPARHWRRVVQSLLRQTPLVLVGAPNEQALCAEIAAVGPAINLAGQTSLPQLAAVIASAGAVVCSDSSANFIAPAVGTPAVTLMGPTRPERTGPYRPGGVLLRAELPCIGCLKRSCSHATCMQLIGPEAVCQAVLALLSGKAASVQH